MSKATGYTRVHELGLGAQLSHLNALALPGASGRIVDSTLTFHYQVKPTALSRSYCLELTYRRGDSPEVRVLSPDIQTLTEDRGRPPHLYSYTHPVRLCLYLPGTGEWRRSDPLSLTMIPWSIEWLFYFEFWLATGEWHGGGAHPQPSKKKNKKRNVQ